MTDRRRRAERRGRIAETAAALLLRAKGYSILAQRFAAPGGEIDIVARRGGVLVFAEVKFRRSLAEARLAVTARGRARIKSASAAWLARRGERMDVPLRFDLIAVSPRGIRHLPDAFR